MIVGAVQSLAYSRYRVDAALMDKRERAMVTEGLTNSVKVLPAEVVQNLSALSAPVMVLMGFTLYAIRLGELEARLKAEKRDRRVSADAGEILANMPDSNAVGYGPETFSQNVNNGFVPPAKADILRQMEN